MLMSVCCFCCRISNTQVNMTSTNHLAATSTLGASTDSTAQEDSLESMLFATCFPSPCNSDEYQSSSDSNFDIVHGLNQQPSSDSEGLFDLTEIPPPTHMLSQVLSMRTRAPEPLLDVQPPADNSVSMSGNSTKRRKRQRHGSTKVARLEHERISMLEGTICPCARVLGGKNCLSHFNMGDIFGLRFANRNLSASEEYAKRQEALLHAAELRKDKCMMTVNGHLICLTSYCLLFDYNRSSMSRSWSRILRGQGVHSFGRPRGTSAYEIPFKDVRALQALQWLRAWIDAFAETSPVGLKCQKSINYILVGACTTNT